MSGPYLSTGLSRKKRNLLTLKDKVIFTAGLVIFGPAVVLLSAMLVWWLTGMVPVPESWDSHALKAASIMGGVVGAFAGLFGLIGCAALIWED